MAAVKCFLDSKRKIAERFDLIAPFLDERMRRLWAAAESEATGRGGIALVARASGVSPRAIRVGISELRGKPQVSRPSSDPCSGTHPGREAALPAGLRGRKSGEDRPEPIRLR